MVDDNTENSGEGFARIKPVTINLTSNSSSDGPASTGISSTRPAFIWLGLGILFISALVVVFLLPNWVNTPEQEAITQAPIEVPAARPAQKTTSRDKVSPWEKAQESRLRKETQDILSQMLEAQKVLSEKAVQLWAAEDYAEAMTYATKGDDLYNQRDFAGSRAEYDKALAIFSRLLARIDVVFKATMEKGNKSLAEGNASAALEAFQLALAIDAIDRAANIGKSRAESLDEVLALTDKGDDLLDRGQYEQAKLIYQQALALDGYFDKPKRMIELADSKIRDREFNKYMSAGFAAMEQKHFSKAKKSFNSALKLKPRAAEARAALEQSGHKLTTMSINALLATARQLEEEEDWHAAAAKYTAALKLDSSLAEAQQGEQRASLRGRIHDRLQAILARPKRLYEPQVYNEIVDFRHKLNALSNPGQVLNKQLAVLDSLLEKAVTPVKVILKSDNQTRVTLRRIGKLGVFLEKSLSIPPGNYVAVGIREGYRDARVEFSVDPDKPALTVTVLAGEKIALGR